jgi:hypothetical protein
MRDKKDIESQLKVLALEYAVYYGNIIEIFIDVRKDKNSAVISCKVKNI